LVSHDLDQMLAEARIAADIIKSGLVLKLVPTENGFRFVARHGNEFPCCITAIFDPSQALIAREAGARFIAVYVNRATKQMGDGITLVRKLATVLSGSTTQIVAASLKSTAEAIDALNAGAQHITVPFYLLGNLWSHPLSAQTIDQFNAEGVGIQVKA
ncbi:MAG: transaldolase family protein, partial [Bacteroidota bacterium]